MILESIKPTRQDDKGCERNVYFDNKRYRVTELFHCLKVKKILKSQNTCIEIISKSNFLGTHFFAEMKMEI